MPPVSAVALDSDCSRKCHTAAKNPIVFESKPRGSDVNNSARAILFATTLLASGSALSAPTLLAVGSLTGSSAGANADLSGLTGNLENGVPADLLGGMGSGLAWAGGNTFLAAPDRGPNAVSYNSAIDDTASYIARYQTVTMSLTPGGGGSTPFTLTPIVTATTLLSSPTALNYGTGAGLGTKIDHSTPIGSGAPSQNTANHFFFTGRSDNFGAGNSGNPANARLDPEGIRVSADGKSVFVSDEYGPYVYQFDRATGQRLRAYKLPDELNVSQLSPVGATEINASKNPAGNTSGRVANKGMEGLAITPDGKTLVGAMQAALIQERDYQVGATNPNGKIIRLVTIDVATGATKQFAYKLTTGSGVSEITAINDHEFLVDERDGSGLGNGDSTGANGKVFYKIDITGATDISGMTEAQIAAVTPLTKTATVNFVSLLNANGITSNRIPAKIEGLAFGDDLFVNGVRMHTLWVANDNDFLSTATLSSGTVVPNPSEFFVIMN